MLGIGPRRWRNAESNKSDVEFRRLLEKLPAAAYTCDAHGKITFFNRRAADLWGREPRLNHPSDRYCGSFRLFSAEGAPIRHEQCWMARALQDNQEYHGREILVERPDGGRRTVLAYASPVHDDSGRLTGATNVLVDITEQKQTETRLREADRRKQEFLAMLAHELRNPLAPIRSGLDLLSLTDCPEQEAIALMQQQVEHLVRLVDDLLDVSRIGEGRINLHREPVTLSAAVRRAAALVRPLVEGRRQELVVSLPEEPIWLDADPVRLIQIFGNLLNNASKFSETKGRIELSAHRHGNEIFVQVRDYGVGIDRQALEQMFEPFFQASTAIDRSPGGLGVGLTLVKRLVEMHGGAVSVRSEGPGRGSAFLVRLPIAATPSPATPQIHPPEPAPPRERRVLVVDDSLGAAKMLRRLIAHLGPHRVEMVHDGGIALEAAHRFRPDVIFLDIGLPSLDGYEVARRLRETGYRSLLVAVTGYGQEEDRRKSKEAGFDEHVVKPIGLHTLRAMLALQRS